MASPDCGTASPPRSCRNIVSSPHCRQWKSERVATIEREGESAGAGLLVAEVFWDPRGVAQKEKGQNLGVEN